MAGTQETEMVLKVDTLAEDVSVAVWELNSNICRNNQPKVYLKPALNYSPYTSCDCHVTLKYDMKYNE